MRSALVCALLLTACQYHVEADFGDPLKVRTLDAEKYKQEIMAIDRLVFADRPLGPDGPRMLESRIENLSEEVGRYPKSKFLKVESLELKLLAKRAGRLSAEGTAHELQDNWMRIRNNLFEDRAWFARSAADLEAVASNTASTTSTAGAMRIARPAATVEPETIERRDALTGRWRVDSVLANGQPRADDELSGSVWAFDLPRLTVSHGGRETTYNCIVHPGYLAVTTAQGEEGWMKYELDSGGLRLAFYDGLKGKPESFDADPARPDPLLVALRLKPAR